MEISLPNGYSPLKNNLSCKKNQLQQMNLEIFDFILLFINMVVGFVVFSDFLIYKVKTLQSERKMENLKLEYQQIDKFRKKTKPKRGKCQIQCDICQYTLLSDNVEII
ncbi:hypothetical protein pb186bvf_010696 [Paramecium bursaria]